MSIAEKFEVIADAVYEKGKQDERSDFWDAYQKNGAQVSNYTYAFAYSHWTDEIYNPKYNFSVTYSTNSMYYNSSITDTKVEHDLSLCTLAGGMFWNSKIKTIRKLIVHEALNLSDTFKGCKDLEYIRFGGVIGQNISFADSPLLTVDSILDVFEYLKDIRGTGTTRTCTLGSVNLAKLTDAEKAIATEKGWTLA
jgi:hypothetical protein